MAKEEKDKLSRIIQIDVSKNPKFADEETERTKKIATKLIKNSTCFLLIGFQDTKKENNITTGKGVVISTVIPIYLEVFLEGLKSWVAALKQGKAQWDKDHKKGGSHED